MFSTKSKAKIVEIFYTEGKETNEIDHFKKTKAKAKVYAAINSLQFFNSHKIKIKKSSSFKEITAF